MVTTPTVDDGAYQSLDEIRRRIDYDGESLFQENAQLQFDKLLVRLERESRGIFETLWGDQTPLQETGRVDEKRATDDSAMLLVYPIQSIQSVERKHSPGGEWETVDGDWYDHTKHRLVLARSRPSERVRRGNPLASNARRATWRDFAAKIRVTYDRGFADVPADIKSIQIALINRMVRHLRQEQTVGAASPDDFAGVAASFDDVVTDSIRQRIDDVTAPGGATMSI